jgi:hypothetical protein
MTGKTKETIITTLKGLIEVLGKEDDAASVTEIFRGEDLQSLDLEVLTRILAFFNNRYKDIFEVSATMYLTDGVENMETILALKVIDVNSIIIFTN